LGIHAGDRVRVRGNESTTAIVDFSSTLVQSGTLGVYIDICECIGTGKGDVLEVTPASRPASVNYIRKKMDGGKLAQNEMYEIIEDITDRDISEIELTAFVTACMVYGLGMDEVEWMTRAMVQTGERISFDVHPVMDHHSIGGVPGNKVSLIIVPIVAAAGLMVPKTSSRAITGAGGTADLMEVFCDVEFSASEVKRIAEKVNGCLVWGGATNIAPADDIIIEVEYPLSIDPRGQLLASVMAKKFAVDASHVVLDIPIGREAKIHDLPEGRKLAREFQELGERLNIQVEVAITYGESPVGRTIGPAPAAQEALACLEGKPTSNSLVKKSLSLAGLMLEMGGASPAGSGYANAQKLLESGAALKKFLEIIEEQGGDPKVKSEDIPLGEKTHTINSTSDGYVVEFFNRRVVQIARFAGAPFDRGAGLVLHKKRGNAVKEGDPLFTIYSEKAWKLENAIKECQRKMPLYVEGMVLERVESGKNV